MKGWNGYLIQAEQYEKNASGYVPAYMKDIFSYPGLKGAGHVWKVGIGGGQAALPFLEARMPFDGCGGRISSAI